MFVAGSKAVMTERGVIARGRRILSVCRPPRWAAPVVIGLGCITALLEAVTLFLFIPLLQSLGGPAKDDSQQNVLGRLSDLPFTGDPTVLLVVLLCTAVFAKALATLLQTGVAHYVEGLAAHRLRSRIFEQTIASCIDYEAGRRTDIVETIATNSWTVSGGLTLMFRLVIAVLTALVLTTLMFLISVHLTLYAIFCLVVSALLLRFTTRHAQSVGTKVVKENREFGLRMWESVNALQLIRSFSRESYEMLRFDQTSDRVRRRMLTLNLLWATPTPLSEVASAILIGALILIGRAQNIEFAVLAAFLSILYRMQYPVREIFQAQVTLEGIGGAIDDVTEYLERTAKTFVSTGDMVAVPLADAMRLEHVSFRYGAQSGLALDDVSFDIPRGRTTAIVGETGAGKSTLFSLLFRFRDPSSGTITADGVPLPELDVASWRARLALMSQEVVLFNDSVVANIAYGAPDTTDQDIRAAADLAGVTEFVDSLPEGFETVVGDQGVRLSGGQRQRIALARTVLRDPDILLLDEATNAFDAESEQTFQTLLRDYARGRTVVVIAHRLSTVRDADQIVVLSKGRVVEVGAPEALLASGGRFARMIAAQNGSSLVDARA